MAGGRANLALVHRTLDSALRRVEGGCAILAGLAALTAMVTVSADALLRHVFSRPLTFQYYLTENYLLVALLLLALPWGYRTGGFIRLGFILDALPNSPATLISRLCLLLAASFVAYLGWLGALAFLKAYQSGEVEMGVIDWPVAWSLVFVPIGMFLLASRLLVDAISQNIFLPKPPQHVD